MNIVLLEDDIALNKAIRKVLELDGHYVDSFFNGKEIMNALDKRYDLYILDINVPYMSGLDILDSILLQNKRSKVIMISSNTDIQSIQKAYDIGCVDYLKKPFHIAELRAKINHLEIPTAHLYTSIKLKKNARTLTKKEAKLLNLLLDHLGLTVNYEMIDNYVYESKTMTMDALRALVRRLREKLAYDIIENVVDQGYRVSHIPNIPHKETGTKVQEHINALRRENSLLKMEKEILLKKSTTDPLTGLYNRIKIQEIFLHEQQHFIQNDDQLSVILLDLDNFKSINDRFGHNIGDKYLQALAKTLMKTFRTIDIIGRWGGEEFIILLPKTSLDEAKEISARLKEQINAINCPRLGLQTASYGLTTLMENDTLSSFVGRADKALFNAKEAGKNRIEVSDVPGEKH
jgi:diguanylate cyclase (GGDEF)-like protein